MADEKKHEINVTHGDNQAELSFQIDEEKAEAIRRCIAHGELRITVANTNLRNSGRFQASYIYD